MVQGAVRYNVVFLPLDPVPLSIFSVLHSHLQIFFEEMLVQNQITVNYGTRQIL